MKRDFAALLAPLLRREAPPPGAVRDAFDAIFAGEWSPLQVASYAVALRVVGETDGVIAEAAEALRSAMTAVHHDFPRVVDTCGTGGDGSHTINLSSGAALVVAACDVPVAKHGNRSASSRCGSADVFEALGIPLEIPPARQSDVLREAGIAFLFARAHHPALRHAAQARSELGTRTLFNALGPLANPARPSHQLIGVYEDALRPLAARALARLGVERAWVVRGDDGLDEISPCAPTRVTEVIGGREPVLREIVVTPEDFGVSRVERAAIAGGDVNENARALAGILAGERHPARDAVVINAAAALALATGDSLRSSAERARHALDSGAARQTLERWRAIATRVNAR
ncbi:MAG: anthranilate phosphoribosyltransferase [Polyangiaceae bacterium]|nr:anthranilate phosphoribosyltransferase [Polyangiaceae bacterium]